MRITAILSLLALVACAVPEAPMQNAKGVKAVAPRDAWIVSAPDSPHPTREIPHHSGR